MSIVGEGLKEGENPKQACGPHTSPRVSVVVLLSPDKHKHIAVAQKKKEKEQNNNNNKARGE